jgi:hypothetical protein
MVDHLDPVHSSTVPGAEALRPDHLGAQDQAEVVDAAERVPPRQPDQGFLADVADVPAQTLL